MGRIEINNVFFKHKSIVRYCDTDQMGIVYHSKYLDYWEWARTDFLKEIDLDYKYWEDKGYYLPVKNMDIDYSKAAKYDDVLSTELFLEDISRSKISFIYKSYIENDLIVSGRTRHLVVNSSFKVTRAPLDYIKKISGYFNV